MKPQRICIYCQIECNESYELFIDRLNEYCYIHWECKIMILKDYVADSRRRDVWADKMAAIQKEKQQNAKEESKHSSE